MSKIYKSIVERDFSIQATREYALNLLLDHGSVSYMVHDQAMNVLALRSYRFEAARQHKLSDALYLQLKILFQEDPYLRLPYQTVRTALNTTPSTLVPEELYQEKYQAQYFQNIVPTGRYVHYRADIIYILKLINIYPFDNQIIDLLKIYFPTLHSCHLNSALIATYARMTGQESGYRVFMNVRDECVHLFVFNENQLIFNNGFAFQSHKDLVYFVILIYKQFQLQVEEVPLMMTGEIEPNSEVCKYLYRYIEYIGFIPAPDDLKFSPLFKEMHTHHFFDLFCLNNLTNHHAYHRR